jgi:hypothetical protein
MQYTYIENGFLQQIYVKCCFLCILKNDILVQKQTW